MPVPVPCTLYLELGPLEARIPCAPYAINGNACMGIGDLFLSPLLPVLSLYQVFIDSIGRYYESALKVLKPLLHSVCLMFRILILMNHDRVI